MKPTHSHQMTAVCLTVVAWILLLFDAAHADFVFGEPQILSPGVDSSRIEMWPKISADSLSLYFIRTDDYQGLHELWMSTWTPEGNGWNTAAYLGPWDDVSSYQSMVSVPGVTTADGLEVFLRLERAGGHGELDIWTATRLTVDDAWGEVVNLGPIVNSSGSDTVPSVSADGLELYFCSDRPGGVGHLDIWVTTRASRSDPWSEPVNLGAPINSTAQDTHMSLSPDGLLLFFDSLRAGGSGHLDLYMARRATRSDPWGTSVDLGPIVNGASGEELPQVSPDGSTLFFDSNRPGSLGPHGMWSAPIVPIVDFNGDAAVDAGDIEIMIDCWGTDEPLCDIGPYPWGDGVVDVEDLVVLVEHIVAARADAEAVE